MHKRYQNKQQNTGNIFGNKNTSKILWLGMKEVKRKCHTTTFLMSNKQICQNISYRTQVPLDLTTQVLISKAKTGYPLLKISVFSFADGAVKKYIPEQ